MTIDRQADEGSRWHLDKKVPISIIAAMLFQFAAGLWFVGRLDARIIALETAKLSQADRDSQQDSAYSASLGLLREDMREIGRKLDRLVERRDPK